jgi:hypothetical protein
MLQDVFIFLECRNTVLLRGVKYEVKNTNLRKFQLCSKHPSRKLLQDIVWAHRTLFGPYRTLSGLAIFK